MQDMDMEVPNVNSYEIFHLTLALNKAPRNAMAFAYKDETCVLLFPGRKERSIFSNTFFNEKQPDCYSNVSADKKNRIPIFTPTQTWKSNPLGSLSWKKGRDNRLPYISRMSAHSLFSRWIHSKKDLLSGGFPLKKQLASAWRLFHRPHHSHKPIERFSFNQWSPLVVNNGSSGNLFKCRVI